MNHSMAAGYTQPMRLFLLCTLFLSGCSLARFQEKRLTHRFQRSGITSHEVELDAATLKYWKGGEGEPLLLLHGFGGDALFTWHGQRSLADRHTVIAPDLVWFGGSHADEGDYGLLTQVQAFVELLDAEGIEKTDLVGISYGGLVAFALTVLHPDRVNRLVLVDTPGPIFDEQDFAALLARFDASEPAEVFVPRDHHDVRGLIELAYDKPPKTPNFLLKDIYKHLFTRWVPEKRHMLGELVSERALLQEMEWRIDQPTLLVWGDHDEVFPIEVGEKLRDAIGDHADMVVIPNARHAPNVEHPDPFNAAIEDFFAHPASDG
jgi:pimeloyl-ACP methyl ester carboxylesterase